MSYVLPYLVPMLERAGANVFLPRERDPQLNEYIVDNDTTPLLSGVYYEEELSAGKGVNAQRTKTFTTAGHSGFKYNRTMYIDGQNPFTEGTFRKCKTSAKATSLSRWVPDIKESGWYYVSVAYVSTANAVPDAHYTVYHAAGATHFEVDQRRGGGTWIYLGKFYFEAGADARYASVTLSNQSAHGGVVSADAVRWGGGMGNVGRRPAGEKELSEYKGELPKKDLKRCYVKDDYAISGKGRIWEAARYYLQWAGAPYEVYSRSQSLNDYSDDYNCRPLWANWLMYGSASAPDSVGLGLGIDAAVAFHSDAGTATDSIIGTMGIYTLRGEGRANKFPNGNSREQSQRLTETVVSRIISDIRQQHCPNWTYRQCQNRNYAETRRAEMPAMILELLSHQNYDDMRYGLDPMFRFTVARALYKGLAEYVATANGTDYQISPLPVDTFAIEMESDSTLRLWWRPTTDTIETTAVASGYVLYESVDGKGWNNGTWTTSTSVVVPFVAGRHMAYKVTAVNGGGESLDSRTLWAYRAFESRGAVMIVDGFDRLSAPQGFSVGDIAGFPSWTDHGVPDGQNLSFVGAQHDFNRLHPWLTDDHAGWGQSDSDFDFSPPMGNDRSHTAIHGSAVANAGYTYVSGSASAIEFIELDKYGIVDLALGEQRAMPLTVDSTRCRFKAFTPALQSAIRRYTSCGGNILVSGAYVASDLWTSAYATTGDREFAQKVLRIEWQTNRASQNGRLESSATPKEVVFGNWVFSHELNDSIYEVESADAIKPAHAEGQTIVRYSQNTTGAAVACSAGGYRSVVCGFPLETIIDQAGRYDLIRQLLNYLSKGKTAK